MQHLFTSPVFLFVLNHGETLLLAALFIFAAAVWLASPQFLRTRFLVVAGVLAIAARVFFAGLKTYLQYDAWAHNSLGQLFLPPHQPWTYFAQYVGTHFWIGPSLAVGMAVLAYVFLRALHRYSDRFFEGGETELGFVVVAVVGWPGAIVFVAGTCIGIILVSLVRRVLFDQLYTTLGLPMLIGGALSLVFSPWLVAIVGLGSLRA